MNSRWRQAYLRIRHLIALWTLVWQIDHWINEGFNLANRLRSVLLQVPSLITIETQETLRVIRRNLLRGPLRGTQILFSHLRWDNQDRYFYFHGIDGPAYEDTYTLLITGYHTYHYRHKCSGHLSLPISPCRYCGLPCHSDCIRIRCPNRDR